ncbi:MULTISPECIES: amino acid ABC transporter permease [unclassified Desulfosporosinus]|uniref:amino acid ABC transporter permease n=1 Tax=unclassified Desulfosporosinus TaxID=2633794 RepID=UPI000223A4BE|nr:MULTISPECIES: amino acid ABC transporter permease [unclassified Desulfosporosinus]EGW37136.1 amino ABC transporter, permease, 3-TM region, His/Glu/Gln/Arg/opine family domain protein [Desulfosporosinus sp. OT]ODA40979.1 amino acid ABC transporter, permease protein [Desulfosporosinus sp. BG]
MEYVLTILPVLMKGLKLSLTVYAIVIILVPPLAILVAIGKVSGPQILKRILFLYTWIWRGTPLLLQLFFIYFGLPYFGINLSPLVSIIIAFVLNVGAYETEIIRAGIESIDKGQYEAAKALGMTYVQTIRRIIIPQTIRRVLPATCSEALLTFKDTALVAAIGMGDLLRSAKEVVTRDFRITAFFIAFIIYLIISSILVLTFSRLEKKYSLYE